MGQDTLEEVKRAMTILKNKNGGWVGRYPRKRWKEKMITWRTFPRTGKPV